MFCMRVKSTSKHTRLMLRMHAITFHISIILCMRVVSIISKRKHTNARVQIFSSIFTSSKLSYPTAVTQAAAEGEDNILSILR